MDATTNATVASPIHALIGFLMITDAIKYESGAHRPTCKWENLLPTMEVEEAHPCLPDPKVAITEILAPVGLNDWKEPSSPALPPGKEAHITALPQFGSRQDSSPFRVHNGSPGKGMLENVIASLPLPRKYKTPSWASPKERPLQRDSPRSNASIYWDNTRTSISSPCK